MTGLPRGVQEMVAITIRASVAVVEDGTIILVPHYDNDTRSVQWVVPGGTLQLGESLIDAATRGFREETGLPVEVTGLLDVSEGTPYDPLHHSIIVEYRGRVVRGSLTAEPSRRQGKTPAWFSAEDLDGVAHHPPRAVDQALRMAAEPGASRFPFDCVSDFIFVEHEVGRADIILVPGGSAPQLMHRASELCERGLAPYILPSGGPNPHLPGYASEWAFLKELGTAAGIPEHAILKEDRATNTLENARYSWGVITREGLTVSKAILVCKWHHSRRALLTYQAVFPLDCQFMVSPIVDRRAITKENWFLDPQKTNIVFDEVRKIGKFLEEYVSRWATSPA